MRFLNRLLITIKEGFLDGVRATFDPIHYYPQEQDRQRIIAHARNTQWTAEEGYKEFLQYIAKYDQKMRLTRTRRLLEVLIENHTELRDKGFRQRIANRLATRL